MEKEQYLAWRNSYSPELLYEYYKENYKGGKMLDLATFVKAVSIWPQAEQAYSKIVRMYDIKFGVSILEDLKTGTVLKYL